MLGCHWLLPVPRSKFPARRSAKRRAKSEPYSKRIARRRGRSVFASKPRSLFYAKGKGSNPRGRNSQVISGAKDGQRNEPGRARSSRPARHSGNACAGTGRGDWEMANNNHGGTRAKPGVFGIANSPNTSAAWCPEMCRLYHQAKSPRHRPPKFPRRSARRGWSRKKRWPPREGAAKGGSRISWRGLSPRRPMTPGC